MTQPLEISKGKSRIRIGYRSPGLSSSLNPDEKMLLCKDLGMSIIEPQISPNEFPTLKEAKAYREAADKHSITITSAGVFLPYGDPSNQDEVESYGNYALEVAEILGIDYMFTLVNYPPDDTPHSESWDLVKKGLHSFASKAQQVGIEVSLEPEWFLGSVERVVKMLKEVNHPNFKLINFDATNFFTNGSDPRDCIRDHHAIIRNGHIKDGFYRTNQKGETKVGEGEVPWSEIFEIMLKTGKEYTMHIEHCNTSEKVISAAKFMRGVIDSLSK